MSIVSVKKKLINLSEMREKLLGFYLSKIVITTGVFDVPSHNGHARYIVEAGNMGDLLIVILHSDSLVEERKGKKPNSSEIERAEFISYWPSVDYVLIAKTQEEVYSLIKILNPSILVTSETTEDKNNCTDTMKTLFGSSIKIKELKAKSSFHSSQFVRIFK